MPDLLMFFLEPVLQNVAERALLCCERAPAMAPAFPSAQHEWSGTQCAVCFKCRCHGVKSTAHAMPPENIDAGMRLLREVTRRERAHMSAAARRADVIAGTPPAAPRLPAERCQREVCPVAALLIFCPRQRRRARRRFPRHGCHPTTLSPWRTGRRSANAHARSWYTEGGSDMGQERLSRL